MHKLWASLVHVHIATEVTLHLGATGLCFIVKGLVGDTENVLASIIGNMLDLCLYHSEGILPME